MTDSYGNTVCFTAIDQLITYYISHTIQYFKAQAADTGIPYQTLINLYLTDCAEKNRKPELSWR